MQIDWAGVTIDIVDSITGMTNKSQSGLTTSSVQEAPTFFSGTACIHRAEIVSSNSGRRVLKLHAECPSGPAYTIVESMAGKNTRLLIYEMHDYFKRKQTGKVIVIMNMEASVKEEVVRNAGFYRLLIDCLEDRTKKLISAFMKQFKKRTPSVLLRWFSIYP